MKAKFQDKNKRVEEGSVELIAMALIATLVVVVCIVALKGIGEQTASTLENLNNNLANASSPAPSP